jgi:hypothetical protein
MTGFPRREVDELYAKYDLHSSIFDIYVEGDFDFDFISMFLKESGINNVSIFHINDIQVDSEIVEQHGFKSGSNKHRLLTLARLFDLRYGRKPTNITCIVDADCDRILEHDHNLHHAKMTDYSCIESYFCAVPPLSRFLTFACHLNEDSLQEFMSIAESVLPIQFTLRATAEKLELNCSLLEFTSGLKKKRDISTFCGDRYLESYISKHGLQKRRLEILDEFNNLKRSLPPDLRHCMQGHDFTSLMFEYLWHHEVRTAKLQTVIDAAYSMLRTLMKDARGGPIR